MRQRIKRPLSFILMLTLILSLTIVPVSAGSEEVTVSTSMEEVAMHNGNQIYKLVFKANSPYGISVMSTVMSYDNAVIVPVHRSNFSDITGLSNEATFYSLKSTLMDLSEDTPYVIKPYYYQLQERSAFLCDMYSDEPITVISDSPVFEFYFRLADGKTLDDLNAATFKVETDKSAESFMSMVYTTEESLAGAYGLKITDKDPNGDKDNTYTNSAGDSLILSLNYTNSTNKIPTTITTPPTASAITYGQSLADSTLSGVASVPGTFIWADGSIKPKVSDSDTTDYSVVFTPSDSAYETVPCDVNLSVNKKALTVKDGDYAVSKEYNTTNSTGTPSGSLGLDGVVVDDDVTVKVTDIPAYGAASAGTYILNLIVALEGTDAGNYKLGSTTYAFTKAVILPQKVEMPAEPELTYTGKSQKPVEEIGICDVVANSETGVGSYSATISLRNTDNYQWEDETTADKTLSWRIIQADYSVEVPTKQIKHGSDNDTLPTYATEGVNSQTPAGTLTWYATEAARTAGTEISAGYVAGLALGADDADKDHTLYWRFVTTDTNYVNTAKEGSTTITIISGEPQNITITGTKALVTYGDVDFTLGTTVTTTGGAPATGGGAVTWSSSDSSVASIDSTGKVTVHRAGTTTITATAAAVPGTYAEGSEDWQLTVEKLALTVTAGTYNVTKVYDGTRGPGTGTGALAVAGILDADSGKVDVNIAPPSYTAKDAVASINLDATLSLSGDQAANYKLASETVSVPCSITARDITAVSVTDVTKTYDGGIGAGDAVINGEPVLTGKVAGDDLGIGLIVTGFSYADVATANKTADITLGALTGTDLGNYNLVVTSPITALATIVPANITGFDTTAPTKTILANDIANNVDAGSLKTHMALPATVTIKYGTASTADLSITWAAAEEAFDIKGGTYTYKGAVVHGTNFNAYAPTLDAVLTVTPVTISNIAGVDGSMTKAKADVLAAVDMTALGFPAQVTLSFDNAVASQDVDADWDTAIGSLKALANTVTDSADKTQTVTLTDTNFPAWATMAGAMPSTLVTITNKLVIDPADITFADVTIIYDDPLSQDATVDSTTYPGAAATYVYTGTGTTVYGPSATPPENAGTYTVTATVENDTHKGTKSAGLTINPKALSTVTLSVIADHGYTGSPITPAYTVTGDSIDLVDGVDYDGVFSANTDVGAATLTVTCKGNYTGTGTTTFEIEQVTPTITFTNTNQTLTAAGGNITDVVTALDPHSDGATVTVHYWVVVTAKADCTVVHDDGCASIASGDIADCDCSQAHTAHNGSCGYVATDIYGWVTAVPQETGAYKIYASTTGDSNLLPVNISVPDESTITDTLVINPYRAGGSKPAPPVAPPVTEPPVTSGDTTTVTTTVEPQTTGKTSRANVPAADMNQAVSDAAEQAAETGTKPNVTVKVDKPEEASKVELTLPKESIETLVEKDEGASLTVETGVGNITFDGTALSAIEEAAEGDDIVIVAEDMEIKSLTKEQQALVGDNPVVDVYIMSGGQRISDFKGGSATVSIPYTLREGEDAEGIVVWYLAEGGKLEKKVSTYDPVTGMATFVAEHFSEYAVAYFPFTDLKGGEWYYENTVYAYMNGLMNGVSKDQFSPGGDTTRAMVVTMLWRLEEEPDAEANSFDDVADGRWYSDAISWAAENGIVTGYSESRFGPDDPVTREQMATIMFNYGTFKKQNMEGRADLSDFADADQVSTWAEAPIKWAVDRGIITGTGKGLDPRGSAQRAQVAAIFQRFIEGNR